MDFFLNKILENDEIKQILLNNRGSETEKQAVSVADGIIKTGDIPTLEPGIMPIFVLGHLADFALQKNSNRGISEEVTTATLKDVNVWLENYKTQFGAAGLGEFHWLINHYTGDLFRLGRLQFRIEKSLNGIPSGEVSIETHVPQGEPLDTDACLKSFEAAKVFFSNFFPEFKPEYFMCDSWLLNPNLADILSENSNIVRFMRLWTVIPFPSDSGAQAIERVFGFGVTADGLKNAPEDTGLQKKLKAYLLSGGDLSITGGYRKI